MKVLLLFRDVVASRREILGYCELQTTPIVHREVILHPKMYIFIKIEIEIEIKIGYKHKSNVFVTKLA